MDDKSDIINKIINMQNEDKTMWDTLRKDYSITKKIGQGAYGMVFKAVRRNDKKVFAIKLIRFNVNEGYGFK